MAPGVPSLGRGMGMATATEQDPLNYILGKGLYDNCRLATVSSDDRSFRMVPAGFPRLTVAVAILLIAAFFLGMHLLLLRYAWPQPSWVQGTLTLLGMLTGTAYTAVVYLRFWYAQGEPWLVYDKAERVVSLPRHGVRFPLEEVAYLQYVTSQPHGVWWMDYLSELNLVTRHDGQLQRWHLVNSVFTHGAFEHLLRPMVAQTPIPVQRVKQAWFGRGTTAEPFQG